jgi:hypothetical protein
MSAQVAENLGYTYVKGPHSIMEVSGFQDKKRLLLDTKYLRERVLFVLIKILEEDERLRKQAQE